MCLAGQRAAGIALACALVFGAACSVGFGSTESVRLTRQAAEALDQQQVDAALTTLDAAIAADPNDAQAVFFQGVALNRTGRFDAALQKLDRAAEMGSTHPDLAFERGWALLGLGRFAEAAESLQAYEAAHPGRGQASEFLGRAYAGMRESQKAREAFRTAIERDPGLRPTVDLYLASLEARQDDPAAARAALEDAARGPDPLIADAARSKLNQPAGAYGGAAARDRLHMGLSVGGGYNSNVYNLGNGLFLPAGSGPKGSAAIQVKPSASYDLLRTPSDSLVLGDQLEADIFQGGGPQTADMVDNYFFPQVQHTFSNQWAASFRAYDEYTFLAGQNFRNVAGGRPAVAWRPVDWAVTEASYLYQYSDYFFPSFIPAQRRSGYSNTLSLAEYVKVPSTPLAARIGYFHEWNQARGSDFLFQSDSLFAGLNFPVCCGIVGDVSYTHLFDRYAHRNSLSGFPRRDSTGVAAVQFSKEVAPHVTVFVGYQYVNDRSNVGFYRYTQQVVLTGATFTY